MEDIERRDAFKHESAPVEFEGNTFYSYAGGGDYGHGGVASDTPALGTRVIIGSNAFTSFDVEGFFEELTLLVLGED